MLGAKTANEFAIACRPEDLPKDILEGLNQVLPSYSGRQNVGKNAFVEMDLLGAPPWLLIGERNTL